MVKVIYIKSWTLHKGMQMLEIFCDEGITDMEYYKNMFGIVRNEYRATHHITVILYYTSIVVHFVVAW